MVAEAYIVKFLEYISYEKKYSLNTLISYRHDLSDFYNHIKSIGCIDITKISGRQVRSFIVNLSRKNLSSRSINRKLAALKSFYRYLQKIDLLSVDPLEQIYSLKSENKIQIPFSIKEMDQLLSERNLFPNTFIGQRDHLIIELLYSTGIRKSELTHLRLVDINIDGESIKVTGKGKKERIIPIRPALTKEILAYLSQRKQITATSNKFVFITKKGKKIYPELVYRIVNTYLSLVSVKLKKSPHILRHTFATHLLDDGANLNAIKELLGHSTLASTQGYIHSSLKQLKSVYSKTHPRETQNPVKS